MKHLKKRLCILLLAAMLAFTAAVGASADTVYKRGDADGDGKVTILDATAIQRKLVSLTVLSFNASAADVNGDGVNILDATKIQRYLAGYYVAEKIGETVTVSPTEDEYELPFIPG